MAFRYAVFAALIGLVSLSIAAPIKYNVFAKGLKVGTYEDETTGDDTQGYVDESTLTFLKEGKTYTIHEIVHYGKDGVNTSHSMEVTGEGIDNKLKAILSDDGAKVSLWQDSDKVEKEVALKTKTSRADQTNFWFKSVQPTVGQVVTYQSFDVQEMTWADVSLTYVGKKTIKLGGKDIEANEIDRVEGEDKGTIYVDSKGDVLLDEEPEEFRIERVMDAAG